FLFCLRRLPTSSLFPYTTLFRSELPGDGDQDGLRLVGREDAHLRRAETLGDARDRARERTRIERLDRDGDRGLLRGGWQGFRLRSEEHTSELQSRSDLVCRLLLE